MWICSGEHSLHIVNIYQTTIAVSWHSWGHDPWSIYYYCRVGSPFGLSQSGTAQRIVLHRVILAEPLGWMSFLLKLSSFALAWNRHWQSLLRGWEFGARTNFGIFSPNLNNMTTPVWIYIGAWGRHCASLLRGINDFVSCLAFLAWSLVASQCV